MSGLLMPAANWPSQVGEAISAGALAYARRAAAPTGDFAPISGHEERSSGSRSPRRTSRSPRPRRPRGGAAGRLARAAHGDDATGKRRFVAQSSKQRLVDAGRIALKRANDDLGGRGDFASRQSCMSLYDGVAPWQRASRLRGRGSPSAADLRPGARARGRPGGDCGRPAIVADRSGHGPGHAAASPTSTSPPGADLTRSHRRRSPTR